VQKFIKDLQFGLPLLWRGNEGEVLVHYSANGKEAGLQIKPHPSYSFSQGEGTVLHYKTKLFILPHQLLNIAEQFIIADLLVQKLIKDLQFGLPLLWRGNEGEVLVHYSANG
jgi:hypothetical protein